MQNNNQPKENMTEKRLTLNTEKRKRKLQASGARQQATLDNGSGIM